MHAIATDLEKTLTESAEQAPVIPIHASEHSLARATRCAQAVLRALGPGLEPLIYARALALQLQAAGMRFTREGSVELRFRGSSLGRRRVDFLLNDLVIDISEGEQIEPRELARMRSTLLAAGLPAGLVLCFAREPLQMRPVKARRPDAGR